MSDKVVVTFKKLSTVTMDGFVDVKPDNWFYDMKYVYGQGLMMGTDETHFSPELDTSRAMAATVLWQLAAILYRFAKTEGKDDTENGTEILRFSDTGDVADWAKEAMAWAVDHGIITGKGGNLLDPQGKATRAEVAAMLMRYCQDKK